MPELTLEQTEVCQTCGRPYFIYRVHNCPGPRSFLSLSPEESR